MSGQLALDLLNNTQWTIGDWCAHLTDDEMAAFQACGDGPEFWAFSDLTDDGVGTCILSTRVLEKVRALAPDLPMPEGLRRCVLTVDDE